MYTALCHERRLLDGSLQACAAVGITDGLAEIDMDQARVKADREAHFPASVIQKAMRTKLQDGEASVESDRRYVGTQKLILNAPMFRAYARVPCLCA